MKQRTLLILMRETCFTRLAEKAQLQKTLLPKKREAEKQNIDYISTKINSNEYHQLVSQQNEIHICRK